MNAIYYASKMAQFVKAIEISYQINSSLMTVPSNFIFYTLEITKIKSLTNFSACTILQIKKMFNWSLLIRNAFDYRVIILVLVIF